MNHRIGRILGALSISLLLSLAMLAGLEPVSQTEAANPPPLYVRTDGNDTLCNGTVNRGYSVPTAPNCAFASIQKGIDQIGAYGTVAVASGTYTENLSINQHLSLRGAGASNTIIDGNGSVTSLSVMTITPSCDVTISGVTIQHGHALTGTLGGGGIKNVGTLSLSDAVVQHNTVQGSGAADSGGGIHNIGTLLLNNVTIFSNTANHGGGGIRSNGPLTITNSTLASNTANVAGGGLLVSGPSTATLENVTISGNNAGNGGGLRNDGHITLNSCTLAGNWTAGTGLGRAIQNSLVITLANTIVSSTMPSDNCAGTAVTSNGHNLDGGDSCGLGSTGDITDTNPLLGPLQDNGGSTLTHALLDGSPAIGRGDDARCPPTDQRGVFRIGTCDIGAYEVARWTHLPLLLRSY